MDRNRVVTITELNLWTALTQADGFRRFENPLFQRGPSLQVLAHLLLPLPSLGATIQLVVVEFGWLIVLRLVVLLHPRMCFDHRLSLRVPGLGVGSSYAVCPLLTDSTYAGGNCDSNVPFCDMCSTQLHVDLSSFLLLVPSADILHEGCTLRVAWLRGSFLHYP